MFVPNKDDRYFTLGTDNNLLQEVPFYEVEQYEQLFPTIANTMPGMFSVNLRDEIIRFAMHAPPMLQVSAAEVIDLACYYYSDWDSVVAVTDDVLQANAVERLRKSLVLAEYDVATAEKMLETQLETLSTALRRFIGIVIGVLSRANVPAIMEFGSCYRLDRIDDYGNVYFGIRQPETVYREIEDDEVKKVGNRGYFES